jgi:hypothetical protein
MEWRWGRRDLECGRNSNPNITRGDKSWNSEFKFSLLEDAISYLLFMPGSRCISSIFQSFYIEFQLISLISIIKVHAKWILEKGEGDSGRAGEVSGDALGGDWGKAKGIFEFILLFIIWCIGRRLRWGKTRNKNPTSW